jgi:hypothetical protein
MKRAALILLALSFLGVSAAWADEAGQKRASAFAQKFYDWYGPIALKTTKEPSSDLAIARRGALFDLPLLRALKADAEASRKSSGDIVGLDFDPFLYTQDIEDKYVVGAVTETDGLYRVDVYPVRKGKREKKPSVVAELKPVKDSFVFTNFLYGDEGDLIAVLKQLADDRANPPKE